MNGYDSTYRGIKDFLLAQKTMEARVAQFSNGKMTVTSSFQNSNANPTTAPNRTNGKGKHNNTNSDTSSRDKRVDQGREDREKHLLSLFNANNAQGIANLVTRHEGCQCHIHDTNCKHNLFQCSIFDKMEASNQTTATAAKSLITETLPDFDDNVNQFARRATSDATRANSNTSNDTTRGGEHNNSTVNKNSMYSVSSNPSSLLSDGISNNINLSSAIAPPTPMTADRHEPSPTFSTSITSINESYPSSPQTHQTKCILFPPPSSSTTAILDSGCTYHMTGSLFTQLNLYATTNDTPPTVTLGDDKHTIQATGWGIIDLLERHSRTRRLALFVPDLGNITLLSIKRHTSFLGYAFHAEANQATLAYPSHLCPIDNNTEYAIPIKALKQSNSTSPILFDETTSDLCEIHSISYKWIQQNLNTYLPLSSIENFATIVTFTPVSSSSTHPNHHPNQMKHLIYCVPPQHLSHPVCPSLFNSLSTLLAQKTSIQFSHPTMTK